MTIDIQSLSLIATIVLAFVGYWITHRSNLELTKRKEQLELVNKRLSEFYGPLYISLLASTAAFKTLNSELLGDQPFNNRTITEKNFPEWRNWVVNIFMPMNQSVEALILENAYLIREEELPTCLIRFMTHVSSYKALIGRWEREDFSEHFPSISFPTDATDYAEKSYKELKSEQLKLIGKLQREDHPAKSVEGAPS